MTLEEVKIRSRQADEAAAVIAMFRAEEQRGGRAILLTPDEMAAYAFLDGAAS